MGKTLVVKTDEKGKKIEVTETSTDSDSIEVSRTSKGIYTWSIKGYGKLDELSSMIAKIEAADKSLKERFGGSNAND